MKTSISTATELLPRNFSRTSTVLEDIEQLDKHPVHSSQAYPSFKLSTERHLQSDSRFLSKPGRRIIQKSMSSQTPASLGSSSESDSDAFGSTSLSSSRGNASPSSTVSSDSRRSPLSTMRSVDNPEISTEPDLHVCLSRRDLSAQEQSVLHPKVNGGASPIQIAHARSWRRRTSGVILSVDLRKQIIQSRNIQAGMCGTVSEGSDHKLTKPKESIIGNSFLGYSTKESGLRSVESILDVHTKIIEKSIQAAVEYRMQQEQQGLEQAVQDEVAAEEARNLGRLQIREDEDQSSLATVSAVERAGENSQVRRELGL